MVVDFCQINMNTTDFTHMNTSISNNKLVARAIIWALIIICSLDRTPNISREEMGRG